MQILRYIICITVKYIYTDEGISGQQQDSSHKLPVVVQGVEVRGGHMVDPRAGVGVGNGGIDRHQVHVMHGHVVTVLATLQEANIDQGCSVKPTVKRCQLTQITFIYCLRQLKKITFIYCQLVHIIVFYFQLVRIIFIYCQLVHIIFTYCQLVRIILSTCTYHIHLLSACTRHIHLLSTCTYHTRLSISTCHRNLDGSHMICFIQ